MLPDRFKNTGPGAQNVATANATQSNNNGGGEQINNYYFAQSQDTGVNTATREAEEKDDCLRSLYFPEIHNRRTDIDAAHPGTCDWLFTTTEFLEWRRPSNIRNHNGVLWIKGNPGSGKSTMMKHAFDHCRDDLFRDHLVVAHFFNARGEILEKSALGMLRSIVYQIIQIDDTLYETIAPSFREKGMKTRDKEWQWHESELKDFLNTVSKLPRSQPLLLLTDALDECEESEVRGVVKFLETLSIRAVHKGVPLRICLSSRHYPNIRMKSVLELTVESSEAHEADIGKYVRTHLRDSNMENAILQKANGIFLWVVLVINLLNKAYDEGRGKVLWETFGGIPGDLETVFSLILCKDYGGPSETVSMLQWVLLSDSPLRPESLLLAVLDEPVSLTSEMMRRRITFLSRGLIEIRKNTTRIETTPRWGRSQYLLVMPGYGLAAAIFNESF
ncbi:hypothetical protein PG985_014070 [Apiospora marii]|uniref:uncharacterized protein n=1 Tax=Apiospora marii TaxID=335849 RepID=UPI003130F38B